jgi:rhamnosyltransferase
LVDNESEDETVPIARPYIDKFLRIEDFKPGAALNLGIREASFENVVLVSGHCKPTNPQWLSELHRGLDSKQSLAGVYGRQIPTTDSTPIDSRDLWTVFGLEDRVQSVDPFFHNANSLIRKSVWEEFKFSETVTNVEDRVWAKSVLRAGFVIKYAAGAVVEHWHGINHNGNLARAQSVVKVLTENEVYGGVKND